MTNPFASLEAAIGYRFGDDRLLLLAMTHRSNAQGGAMPHNQRLEFLGDAVLGVLVAEMLYRLYPDAAEGDLSKRLVSLVNGAQLTEIATQMALGEYLILSNSEEDQGGRSNASNLEDACEALLGAVYLDGGLESARRIVEKYWKPYAQELKTAPKDAKTALQEWAQARSLPLPEYVLLSSDGPAHAPHFVVEVRVKDQPAATGEAGTKRAAERLAAEALLKQLA